MNAPTGSIYERFEQTAKNSPDNTALVYLGRTFKYSELYDMIETFAAGLYAQEIRRNDKAILYLPNSPQWIIAWLSLLRIGAMAVPVSPFYAPNDLKYMINDSNAKSIFCLDTNFGYVSQVMDETELKRVVVSNVADLVPFWKYMIGVFFDKIPRGKYPQEDNVFPFKKLLRTGAGAPAPPPHKPDPEEMVEMLYTGGTTGLPKGVPFTNTIFLEGTASQRSMSESQIPKGKDIVIQGGPLFHILGQAMGIGALLCGDTLVLLPRVNLDGLFHHIQRYRVRTFFGVPTLYRLILDHDRLDLYDLSSLEYCFSGGDVLPHEVDVRWLNKFGIPIYQGYGATETCGGVALTPIGVQAPLNSGGKIVPFQQVNLVDPETLQPAPEGETGELLVSSEHMVREYWNKPDETAECFVEIDGTLWYRTRDFVRIDKEGWLFYQDRAVDIIKHKGYRVASSEIEAVLQGHHAVVASCVVGIPDEKVGERIKAFVVLKRDIKGVSAFELIKWCRDRLASYKVPQYIEFRDMLPKSKVGKLLRRELRSEEQKKSEKD